MVPQESMAYAGPPGSLRDEIVRAAGDLARADVLEDLAARVARNGSTEAARLLLLAVSLRSGFSPHEQLRQDEAARRARLEPARRPVASARRDVGSPLDVALGELKALFDAEAAPTGFAPAPDHEPLRAEAAPPASAAFASGLIAPLTRLGQALAEPPSPDGSQAVADALQALGPELLNAEAYEIDLGQGDAGELAWRLAVNAARAAIQALLPLAGPPFGSPGVLHRLAWADETGLGPYGGGVEALVRDGRGLLALLQLARGRTLEGSGEREAIGRWACLLSTTSQPGFRIDVVNGLADLALKTPLWALLTQARGQAERPDRGLLQAVRDGGMDLGDLELAWRVQELIASIWPQDKGEWLALGDLAAAHSEHVRAEEAFAEAVRLDPDEDYARQSLDDLRCGRRERFGPRPGFGTPDARHRLRAERAAGRWREPPDDREGIKALQQAAARQSLVPEVAPQDPPPAPARPRDGLHLHRLGARRSRSPWGELPVLRGVEAVRGVYTAREAITAVEVRLAGRTLGCCAPRQHSLAGDGEPITKWVFNIWIDASAIPPGRREVEIILVGQDGRRIEHRESVLVQPPWREADHPGSDAVLDPPVGEGSDLAAVIDARSSQVRPAQRRGFDQPPERVLVVRADQLGDLVCSVPALQRLREILPRARVTGLVSPANAALARTLRLFDEVLVAPFDVDPVEGRRVMPLERQAALRTALHARCFDLALDLADNSPSRFLLLLSGAKRLCGVEGERYGFLDLGFQAHARDPANGSENLSAAAKMAALVEWLGAALKDFGVTLRRDDLDPGLLARHRVEPGRYAVLHTGARLAFSRWPHYPALAARLLERTELAVVLLADGLEAGARLAPSLTAHPRLRLVEHTPPFDELDALVSQCAVFVGNDSGPKHLASLRGAEVVSLHCARNNWNEWGQENRGVVMSRRVPCAGCQISDHPEECGRDIACLRLISPDEVLAATLARLEARA